MNQFLRWALIIGSWMGGVVVMDLFTKSSGRTPMGASIEGVLFVAVPLLVAYLVWRKTRAKQ